MGKTLQDLGLKDDLLPTAGQDLDTLPDFGAFRDPPQPGAYRFQLPDDLTAIWELFETTKTPSTRVRAIFDADHPLTIVQSPGNRYNGEPFTTRFSNDERNRGSLGMHSDMDFVLKALGGVKTKPKSNRDYIQALQQHKGKQFGADIRYSWKCDARRNIRIRDGQGTLQEVQGRAGCGAQYYQRDLPNEGRGADGQVPTQIQCNCGAVLRCFANLENFRA